MCSLRQVYHEFSSSGIGDPTSLVLQWHGKCPYCFFVVLICIKECIKTAIYLFQGISSRMSFKDKTSPNNVLHVFVDLMKLHHLGSVHSSGDLLHHHLAQTWKYTPMRESEYGCLSTHSDYS